MNYYATEVVHSLDDIKKAFFMTEFLEQKELFYEKVRNFDMQKLKNSKNLEQFSVAVRCFADDMLTLVPTEKQNEWCSYELYTNAYHGDKFWNELPLPEVVQIIFEAYINLAGLRYSSSSKYVVNIYDLSDQSFFFNTAKQMHSFLDAEDIAPYVAFRCKKIENVIFFDELFSA